MTPRLGVPLLALALAFVATPAAAQAPTTYLLPSRIGSCAGEPNAILALDCWLVQHPGVADEVKYYSPAGFGVPWKDWPLLVKGELRVYFNQLVIWYHDGMPSAWPQQFPVPVPNDLPDDPVYGFRMSEALGRKVHLSYVANSLAAELTGAFPWTITTYTPNELHLLLDMNEWISPATTDSIAGYAFRYGSPSPAVPGYTVTFFKDNQLLAPTAAETVGLLFEWERQLAHYFGVNGKQEVDTDFWGPNTPPIPDSKIIEGTTYSAPGPFPLIGVNPFQHWTAGCGGTMFFMKSVLRAVNIPVERHWLPACQHATPIFPTIGLALTHGDDPYGSTGKVSPTLYSTRVPDGLDYFKTINEFNKLFPPGQSPQACTHVVGIGAIDVAIEFGSDYLMDRYCEDLQANASPANGKVYQYLQWYYALAQLQNMGLWTTLADKAAITHWCQ